MKLDILVRFPDGSYHQYGLDFDGYLCNIIDIPDEIYLEVYKVHNHLYGVRYFLYRQKKIGFESFRRLKEMFNFVQKFLKENLFDIVQK